MRGCTASASTGATTAQGGRHSYAEEGRPNLSLTLNDSDGAGGPLNVQATVVDSLLVGNPANVRPVEGQTFTAPLATFSDLNPQGTSSDYTTTITWGDGRS